MIKEGRRNKKCRKNKKQKHHIASSSMKKRIDNKKGGKKQWINLEILHHTVIQKTEITYRIIVNERKHFVVPNKSRRKGSIDRSIASRYSRTS